MHALAQRARRAKVAGRQDGDAREPVVGRRGERRAARHAARQGGDAREPVVGAAAEAKAKAAATAAADASVWRF